MAYFSEGHLRLALQRLPDTTHQALVTFLAMLRSDVPMSDTAEVVPYGLEQEGPVLNEYFRPSGGLEERPYYVPFGAEVEGQTRWKKRAYSGTSLQRMRTGVNALRIYRAEVIDATKSRGFALRGELASILSDSNVARKVIGSTPLSAHLLAVWLYRNKEIGSHADAISKFTEEFRVRALSLQDTVFSLTEDPQLSLISLSNVPLSDKQITAYLEPLPEESDVVEDGEADVHDRETGTSIGGSWEISLGTLDQHILDLKGVRSAAVQALSALRAGMHVVFLGPPGCGKTELAKRVCAAAGFSPWLVTATDSWTTFETIGGYFPQFDGEKERLDFEAGVVTSSMQQGTVLIIDEINRADIDKAFGELFTLLSGSDVDLPHRRRGTEAGQGRRIRLVMGDKKASPNFEAIHMPSWWRIIGSMNDADKASLKKLSFAFVRRFAFIPVGLPDPGDYSHLLTAAATAANLLPAHAQFVESLTQIFANPKGLSSFGMSMGFAIPKAMISQAVAEIGLDPGRSDQQLLASAFDLYLAPQFQGWAEKHEQMVSLARDHLDGDSLKRFETSLEIWTGYVS